MALVLHRYLPFHLCWIGDLFSFELFIFERPQKCIIPGHLNLLNHFVCLKSPAIYVPFDPIRTTHEF